MDLKKAKLRLLFLGDVVVLTDGIFETGGVPSESQNSTILGQGGPLQHIMY